MGSTPLLTRAVAGVSRSAVLWQPGALEKHTRRDRLQRAEVAGRTLTDLEGGAFWTERKRLVELAVKSRLPAVYARLLRARLPSTKCPPKRGAA